jgi:hypothetical protein
MPQKLVPLVMKSPGFADYHPAALARLPHARLHEDARTPVAGNQRREWYLRLSGVPRTREEILEALRGGFCGGQFVAMPKRVGTSPAE